MRNRILLALLLASLSFSARPAGDAIQPVDHSVTYAAKAGPGQGRHVVLLSGDEEYRSEEALPMLAKILSQRHGFKTTVLFSVDPDGTINPKNTRSLSNAAALDTADAVVMSLRFRAWPDEDMARFEKFLRPGKPIVALRTSTHAFNGFPRGSRGSRGTTTTRADLETRARRNVADALGPPQGRGDARRDRTGAARSTRCCAASPIMFGDTDVYEAYPPADATILVRGVVLQGMTPDSPPATHRKTRATDKQEQGVNDPADAGRLDASPPERQRHDEPDSDDDDGIGDGSGERGSAPAARERRVLGARASTCRRAPT